MTEEIEPNTKDIEELAEKQAEIYIEELAEKQAKIAVEIERIREIENQDNGGKTDGIN